MQREIRGEQQTMAIAHATKTRGQKRARQEEALKNMVADGAQRCMTAVHATPHIPSAWGGFHRLRPNNIPFATMQKLAACNFQPKKTHLAPHLLGGYKDSYETALFLSHQACTFCARRNHLTVSLPAALCDSYAR